jgi:hypothetical protein
MRLARMAEAGHVDGKVARINYVGRERAPDARNIGRRLLIN